MSEHAFADVEELLFPGYLSASFDADGVHLSLRTLFPADYHALKVRTSGAKSVRDWKEWAIAHAIWEVDGQIVSAAEFNTPHRIRGLLRPFSQTVIEALFAVVSGLRSRVEHALQLLEGYTYSQSSRGRWRMATRHSPSMAAPPWIAPLGSNVLQQLWVAFNLAEDDRIRWENDWHAAKTIASTMSPKWVKEISDKEAQRWSTEESRRAEVTRLAMQGKVAAKQVSDVENGIRTFKLRTNEDLVEQMQRWQRGEYDDHDDIVHAYKEGIRQRQDEAARAHTERMSKVNPELLAAGGVAGGTTAVAYTPEQLAELGIKTQDGPRQILDESASGFLYDRYIAREPNIGGLRPDGRGGQLEEPSVGEQVAGRRVRMPGEGV